MRHELRIGGDQARAASVDLRCTGAEEAHQPEGERAYGAKIRCSSSSASSEKDMRRGGKKEEGTGRI